MCPHFTHSNICAPADPHVCILPYHDSYFLVYRNGETLQNLATRDQPKQNLLKFCKEIDCVKLKDAKYGNYNALPMDTTHAGGTM